MTLHRNCENLAEQQTEPCCAAPVSSPPASAFGRRAPRDIKSQIIIYSLQFWDGLDGVDGAMFSVVFRRSA